MNDLQVYDIAMRQIAEWHRQVDRDRLAALVPSGPSIRQAASHRIRRGFTLTLAAAVAFVSQTR